MSGTRKPDQRAATPTSTPTTDPGADQGGTTRRQRDDATGENPPGHEPPYRDLKRPDEHDESAERDTSHERDQSGTRPIMQKGANDLAQGREDTDCYGATAPRYQRHRERNDARDDQRESRERNDAQPDPTAQPDTTAGPDPHRRRR